MKRSIRLLFGLGMIAGCGDVGTAPPPPEVPVDATTLNGKFLWGYQGWFLRPGDKLPWRAWGNWAATNDLTPQTVAFDMWPDMSECDPDERETTGFLRSDGTPMTLYSNYPAKTTMRHFGWMKEYGIDGVFLQRFLQVIIAPDGSAIRDRIVKNVRAGAEAYGRVFANMYDITGLTVNEITKVVSVDWPHLVDDLKITESPSYLRHKGKPVIAIWGYPNAWDSTWKSAAAKDAADVIDFLKNNPNPKYRATVLIGLPTNNWIVEDSDWKPVLEMADVISPWTVGSYWGLAGADGYRHSLQTQVAAANAKGIDFMPVVWPGSSTYHQNKLASPNGDFATNAFPRLGGDFLWRQVYNARSAGATMMYGAMFDEYNEGTQIAKTVATAAELPTNQNFLGFDADGVALPGDWYLKLAGQASRMVRGEIPASPQIPVVP